MSRNVTELKPGAPSMLLSIAASDGNELCTQISGKRCRLNEHTGVQMTSHCSLWPDRGIPTHGHPNRERGGLGGRHARQRGKHSHGVERPGSPHTGWDSVLGTETCSQGLAEMTVASS